MAKTSITKTCSSPYKGCCFVLTTKHSKSIAIAPHFEEILGAGVLEYQADTDILGTFTGEVERIGSSLECVRNKCEWSLRQLGDKVKYAIASEGSFGPHPLMPFIHCDHEILYMIDRHNDFHLQLSVVSKKTNYMIQSLESKEELQKFAMRTLFPSHALIMRPNVNSKLTNIFKGICSNEDLEAAFIESRKLSADNKVLVATDMRAHFNPTRMSVIAELALQMAERLKSLCPRCYTPGWGIARKEKGLPCEDCGLATELTKSEIFSCSKCRYEHASTTSIETELANAKFCENCNP